MISFSLFMKNWLYDKDGYYSGVEIGKAGDFFRTASSGRFFGGSIANYIIQLLKSGKLQKDCTIIEMGSHDGELLYDIVEFLYKLDKKLISNIKFAIIEPTSTLVEKQKKNLKDRGLKVNISYFKSIKDGSFKNVFIVANELFNSFPCEAVDGDTQAFVDDNFNITFEPINKDVKRVANRYKVQRGEVVLGYQIIADEISGSIDSGYFLTFNHGDISHSGSFSLKLKTGNNTYPFFSKKKTMDSLYKKSNISYDVHFQALIDAFKEVNFEMLFFKRQSSALVEDFKIIELIKELHKDIDKNEYSSLINSIRPFMNTSGIGGNLKALCLKIQHN